MADETIQDRIVRHLRDAHAAAQANELDTAIELASAAFDDWNEAGCPDSYEAEEPTNG